MGNGKQEKKNQFIWDAAAFRKKCIRLIAYICVFFIVLNRRLSVRWKKWLSISFCSCAVAVVVIFSVAGQREIKMTGKEMPVVQSLSGNHNRVTGGQTEASIEMNRSCVTGDQSENVSTEAGDKSNIVSPDLGENRDADTNIVRNTDPKIGQSNRVVAADQSESTPGEQPNMIVDEPEVLSPIQALLENNGESRQSATVEMRYQYPVSIGDDVKQNYDGVQSAADYIKKMVYVADRVEAEGAAEGELASPGAISISQTAIQAEVDSASATNDESVSGAACSGVEDIDTKDTDTADAAVPVLALDEGKYRKLQGKDKTIFCTNDNNIQVVVSDGEEGTGVEKICYVYGDKLRYCIDPSQNCGLQVSDNFYGQIIASGFDAGGNRSEPVSGCFLVENRAPQIRFSQDDFCTAPYTFWVDIGETGDIVSGIRDVTCTVNGQPYEITNLAMLEKTLLDEELEVPTGCEFSIPFAEEGDYSVVVTVTDNAGNTATEEKLVQVTKPELISVFMPEKFAIHIDPQRLSGKEQIYSDDITLKNDSDFDVQVTVKKVEVLIKDDVSDTGIRKDCDLYMIAPDTGEKIPLKKGENRNVYSYCLKKGVQDDMGKLRFVGDTTEGSEAMWEDSDVVIRMDLGFSKMEKG